MVSNQPIIVVWFRQDLRLVDNPALIYAAKNKQKILPLYILDDENSGQWQMGAASRCWLHQSLSTLNRRLNGHLCLAKGDALSVLDSILRQKNVTAVYWNRCYEPWRIKRDALIEAMIIDKGIEVKSFNGSLLCEPHTILKKDGTPYKVFTPFYEKGLSVQLSPRPPRPVPARLNWYKHTITSLRALKLLSNVQRYQSIKKKWTPGEEGAQQRLSAFLQGGLSDYKEGRDYPARESTSYLSPHLHFGELSPCQIRHTIQNRMRVQQLEKQGAHFLRELGWREFSYYLLYHFPDLPEKNMQPKFDHFPWRDDKRMITYWQKGQTGYPIVDAGMRELWQTGYMHNRVRMIVASFLVKNLLQHWHHGEKWFWDMLVDADLANNSASWQWVAGCGADAAPYFRIFNPVTQGEKFDTHGNYTRRYVPELATLPDKYLHCPWSAPEAVLKSSGIVLGDDYPFPIVELKASRESALSAFAKIKKVT